MLASRKERLPCGRRYGSKMRFPPVSLHYILLVFEVTNSVSGPSQRKSIARVINNGANRNGAVLEPFYGLGGQSVPGFPRTLGDPKRLNGKCPSL